MTSVKTTSIRLFIQVILLSFVLTLSLLGGYKMWSQRNLPTTPLSNYHQTQSEFELNMEKSVRKMLTQIVDQNAVQVSIHADVDYEEQQITKEFLDASTPQEEKEIESFYGFSKRTTLSSSQGGRIKKLSIAVLLDSTQKTYSSEEKENIKSLIYTTVGFDATRGDTLEVQTLPFVQPTFWQKISSQTVLLFCLIVLLTGCLGILWIRSMNLSSQAATLPKIKIPDFANPNVVAMTGSAAQINGDVTPTTLTNVKNLVQEKPTDTMAVLRSWLCQEDEHVL